MRTGLARLAEVFVAGARAISGHKSLGVTATEQKRLQLLITNMQQTPQLNELILFACFDTII